MLGGLKRANKGIQSHCEGLAAKVFSLAQVDPMTWTLHYVAGPSVSSPYISQYLSGTTQPGLCDGTGSPSASLWHENDVRLLWKSTNYSS